MKTTLHYIAALLIFATVTACGDSEDAPRIADQEVSSGAVLGACYSAEHCGPGTVCAQFDEERSAGQCYRACYLDGGVHECPGGSVCSPIRDGVTSTPSNERPPDGACVPLVEEPGDVWSSCASTRDCRDGLQCTKLPGDSDARCLAFCASHEECAATVGERSRCQLSLQRSNGTTLRACAETCDDEQGCSGDRNCTTIGTLRLCTR